MNNNVDMWVAPLAATSQYEQYYANANLQSGTYIPYNSTLPSPSFFDKLTAMIKARECVDYLKDSGLIDEEEYKLVMNKIRLQELNEDFE